MPLPHPPVSILPITLVPPWQGHSTVSEPQLPGLSLPCCVRGEPDIGEAVGFGKLRLQFILFVAILVNIY